MVWRNEGEVDGLARVCAKRYRVNRDLSEGVGGEGEERKGRWFEEDGGDRGEGVGRRWSWVGGGVAVDEVGEMAMMIEVGHLGEVAASFLVGWGRLRGCRWVGGGSEEVATVVVEGVVRRDVFVYVAKRNSWSRLAKGLGEVY